MENGYELLLECYDNTKSGEIRPFLEVPYCFTKTFYPSLPFFHLSHTLFL